MLLLSRFLLLFFIDTAPTEISTLSLHDALPISLLQRTIQLFAPLAVEKGIHLELDLPEKDDLSFEGDERLLERVFHNLLSNRSEEHTSELQSPDHLVCRLLLEKKKKTKQIKKEN